MTEYHISDNEIQEYLDQSVTAEKKRELEKHIKECETCQYEVSRYRELSTILEKSGDPVLTSGLADRVMLKLENKDRADAFTKNSLFIVYIAATVVMIGTTIYYSDLSSFTNLMTKLVGSINLKQIFDFVPQTINNIGFKFGLPVLGAIVILFLALMDKFLKQRHSSIHLPVL